MMSDSDVDRRLRELGDRWRQGVPLNFDMPVFGDHATRRPDRPILVGVGTLAVMAASVAVLSALGGQFGLSPATGDSASAQPQVTQGTSTNTTLIVRSGDAVVGVGSLLARDGDLFLCPTEPVAITGGFGCLGADLVRVVGADSARWDGQYVQVEGIWDGEAVRVTEVIAARRPAPSTRPVPCAPPPGGWPGFDPPDAAESAGRDLEQEVYGNPDLYVGIWPAATTDPGGVPERVIVVGTVGDVAEVAANLRSIYPYNLCVTAVAFSRAELQAVRDHLARLDQPWHLDIDPSVDRVVVTTTTLGPAAAEAIAPFGAKVEVRPTLRKVAPGS